MNASLAERRYSILQRFIPEHFTGAEIGVFKGHFSKVLLRKRPKKLFLVDPWYRLGAEWHWVKGENASTLDAFNGILHDFDQEIRAGIVVPVVEFSTTFLITAPKGSFDFVYLDSSHSYEETLAELSLVAPLLSQMGVLLGDDWHDDPTHRHYGVARAVNEYTNAGKCQHLFTPSMNQWGVKFT